MIDPIYIRERKEDLITGLRHRNKEQLIPVVDQIVALDETWRAADTQINQLRSDRNARSKSKPSPEEIAALQELRTHIQTLEEALAATDAQRKALLASIPNVLDVSVPVGPGEEQNVELSQEGEIPTFTFTPKEHFDIAAANGIDIERGAKVAGSRFYYLRGSVARLERALMNYAMDFMMERGFTLTLPPILVGEQALYGTGYFPNGRNEVYAVNPGEDNLYLIGTSEQALMAMHADESLPLAQGARKYVGYSPCFRREAGSYGKDTKGILRVHQFNKVEMVVLCAPSESWDYHAQMVAISCDFYRSLGIAFRTLQLCSGDTGAQSAKTIDIEAWFPGQNRYREVGSASNTTDYQTRRLNIRMKDAEGKSVLAHALNNTVTADRTMLAILENFQHEDGSVTIPEVLRPYYGGERMEPQQAA